MKLTNIRTVLVATTHPGNIGASARAMKTMGLSQLYLVNPKSFPAQNAVEMAAGADDILQNAIVTSSLGEALKGCHLAIATSARPRGLSLPGFTPAECAHFVNQQTDDTKVALVFGREHAGLTNEELLSCHFHVAIPSSPDFSSLNLAQAVQVLAYELRIKQVEAHALVASSSDDLATTDDVDAFYTHLNDVLTAIRFLKQTNPGKVSARLRRLFGRIRLEKMEVNMLRGILSQVQKTMPKV